VNVARGKGNLAIPFFIGLEKHKELDLSRLLKKAVQQFVKRESLNVKGS
jgi:hypothetical protein